MQQCSKFNYFAIVTIFDNYGYQEIGLYDHGVRVGVWTYHDWNFIASYNRYYDCEGNFLSEEDATNEGAAWPREDLTALPFKPNIPVSYAYSDIK